MKSIEERFWEKVQPEPNTGCWLWIGATMGGSSEDGRYGQFRTRDPKHISAYAHRVSYEMFKGKIPDGMQIDHLCKVRLCVNPSHIEPVSVRENLMRAEATTYNNFHKTHCMRGHEFTEENTYRKQKGWRSCQICRRDASDRSRRRRMAKEKALMKSKSAFSKI